MDRRTFAVIALLAGLGLGLVGNLLFYNQPLGFSFPVFIGASVALVLLLAKPAGVQVRRRNLWPLVPMMGFALMVAVRADPLITSLNIAATLTLGGLALYYITAPQALDEDPFVDYIGHTLETSFMVLPYGFAETAQGWEWLRERRQRGAQFAAVTRGLVFALPIVAVFTVLLGSADAVFARYVTDAWNGVMRALGIEMLGDTFGRGLFTLALALIVTGGITWGLKRKPLPAPTPTLKDAEVVEPDESEGGTAETAADEKRKPAFKLSMVESGIIMGSVVALFAVFVVIQFAYFFGGQETIAQQGLSYAQYARRGFFELVAVAGLTLGLALWLDRVTLRQGRENVTFRGLALAIVALTSVMLVSAFQRMWLYEEAFGFTQLRVYVHVFMVWLGVLFGVFVLALFRVRKNVFSLGSLLVIIGYLGTLNLMNIDGYIAERNIARYRAGETEELDIAFLNILSSDAVAPIAELYQSAEAGSTVEQWSGQWLARHRDELVREQAGWTLFNANLAKRTAWDQVLGMALPEYDPSLWWGSYWSAYDANDNLYGSGWDDAATLTPGTR